MGIRVGGFWGIVGEWGDERNLWLVLKGKIVSYLEDKGSKVEIRYSRKFRKKKLESFQKQK
jgi:hypothetical protein